MKKILVATVGVVVATALVIPVIAEDAANKESKEGKKASQLEQFKKADANADGKLSLEEFKTMSVKGHCEKKFQAADTDKDGFITPDELKTAHAKGKKAKKGEEKQ